MAQSNFGLKRSVFKVAGPKSKVLLGLSWDLLLPTLTKTNRPRPAVSLLNTP